jgi:hypothetical protein
MIVAADGAMAAHMKEARFDQQQKGRGDGAYSVRSLSQKSQRKGSRSR